MELWRELMVKWEKEELTDIDNDPFNPDDDPCEEMDVDPFDPSDEDLVDLFGPWWE